MCKTIQDHVIINKEPGVALEKLLQLPGLAKYHRNLKTEDEKEHFLRHLRKYINMYLPDCPFEVGTTNRYTITTAEAAIVARKHIRKGEPIKYLSGIQVEMTEKEEKELSSRTDFSIVLSSRRKRPSLFLGPARFANHDCDSNAKLNTTGPHGIHIVACKEIATGDEITVTYGEDYFGEKNCECLCSTCEGLQRNGWDPHGPLLNDDSSDEESEAEEEPVKSGKTIPDTPNSDLTSARKRKRDEAPTADDEDGEADMSSRHPRRRLRQASEADDAAVSIKQSASGFWNRIHKEAVTIGADSSADELQSPVTDVRKKSPGHKSFVNLGRQVNKTNGLRKNDRRSADASSSESPPSETINEEAHGDVIRDKVLRLLGRVADRRLRAIDPRWVPKPVSISRRNASTPCDDGAIAMGIVEPATRENAQEPMSGDSLQLSNRSNRLPILPSHRDSEHSFGTKQKDKNLDVRASESDNSKLTTIRNERSVSSLRNVVNANDSSGNASGIHTSPGPQGELSQRTRSRSRKHAMPEDGAAVDSNSPPSSGLDNSSSASLASSATSVDIFAAGSIAQNICEMFTTSIQPDDSKRTRSAAREASLFDVSPRRSSVHTEDPNITDPVSAVTSHRDSRSPRRKPRSKPNEPPSTPPVPSIEKSEATSEDKEDEKRGPARTPGDYTLCRTLLPTTYHRWVECRNCEEFFVQGDAYLTRIACPRCERHSKLYGYYWPKADKEGKHDREERVLDHRTIHRFIDPDDERNERKGRKTLVDALREKEMYGRMDSEDSDKVDKKFRISPRRSESRRKMRTTM